ELYLGAAEGFFELFDGAGPDDGGRDDGVVEEPGERDVGGLFAELGGEAFEGGELVALLVDVLFELFAGAAAFCAFLEGAAEQAAGEGAPGDEAHAVVAAGGD